MFKVQSALNQMPLMCSLRLICSTYHAMCRADCHLNEGCYLASLTGCMVCLFHVCCGLRYAEPLNTSGYVFYMQRRKKSVTKNKKSRGSHKQTAAAASSANPSTPNSGISSAYFSPRNSAELGVRCSVLFTCNPQFITPRPRSSFNY